MEGAIHHFRDMPGSSLVYMLFPFFNTFNSVICRYLLRQRGRYLFVEKHVSSIFLLVYMISITEGPYLHEPWAFQDPPCVIKRFVVILNFSVLTFTVCQEYFNILADNSSINTKKYQTILCWAYYLFRNLFHYGKYSSFISLIFSFRQCWPWAPLIYYWDRNYQRTFCPGLSFLHIEDQSIESDGKKNRKLTPRVATFNFITSPI